MKPWDLPTYGEIALIVIAIASVVLGACAVFDRMDLACCCGPDDGECPQSLDCYRSDEGCADCPIKE